MRAVFRRRWFQAIVALVVAIVAWNRIRHATRPLPPRPDEATFAQAARVRIVRDTWGVPHVFGKSDGDAAFGLAYANAEDDWPMIQGVMAASVGKLGLLMLSKKAIANDYYVSLVRVKDQVDAQYDKLGADYRDVLESYARGLNLYAFLHPEEADGRLFPLTGRDVAAGFAHKIPLMFDLPDVLGALIDGPPKHAGDPIAAAADDVATRRFLPGSNAHAVAARRSKDGVARLNVNSHQPWEGPVAWYEAQVVSEQGWNMSGGLFPGSPIVLHGHNDHLGWAHTVNVPDLVDVYELSLSANGESYVVDGQSKPLEVRQAPLAIDTGWFVLTLHKAAYYSEHGPVVKGDKGTYAIRYAGMDRALRAGEQWYRMNKARSFAEWKTAMSMQAIPMFNTAFADRENIFYVYNALLPVRRGSYDYKAVLPGDKRDAIWTDYVPFAELPQVENPPSGFVQTCNSSPFATTAGAGNPDPKNFAANAGIETVVTNRAARSLALLGGDAPIGRDDFLRCKWDRTYGPDSAIFKEVVRPLLALRGSREAGLSDRENEALEILAGWDGVTDENSPGATIAILAWRMIDPKSVGMQNGLPAAPRAALHVTVEWLTQKFRKVNVAWGAVQRLRRGTVDLPLGGGPDVLNAVRARDDQGRLVGYQGDSLVMLAEFADGGVTSTSIHQYGASNRPASPHYADQAKDFTAHVMKPTLRDPAELAKHTERQYHPGEEKRPQ